MNSFKRCSNMVLPLIFTVVMLTACGGGGGGGGSSPAGGGQQAVRLSGTAASGSPVANATVTLVGSSAATTATGTTGADGSFNISASGLTPPFMIKVVTASGNTLYSVSADSLTTTTINITPLTDIIIRSWYKAQGASVDTAFGNPGAYPPPTPTEVKVIGTVVQNAVQGWLQGAGVDTTNFNLITTPFNADGTGIDHVLDMTSINPTTGVILVTDNTLSTTQTTTVTANSGSISLSTTETTSSGTTSPLTTGTVVPTNSTQSTVLDAVNSGITSFVNTVNQKGTSLQASDLAPYVDPGYMDNGLNASQWEAKMASNLAGTTMTYTGLQIKSLDTTNNVADVTFQVSMTKGGGTETQFVDTYFKQVNGSWLISGNGRIANAYATTWAWKTTNSKSVRFAVDDPQSDNVQSVTVSGPGLTGSVTVPMVCDSLQSNGLPVCGNSYGDNTLRAFQYDLPTWPTMPASYTFTLTKKDTTTASYVQTVQTAFGFDATGVSVPGDYPNLISASPAGLTFSQILSGVTVTGSMYIPIWVDNVNEAPHYNYMGAGGATNNVTNQDVNGTWDAGYAIPGQMNNFTIVIPAATVDASGASCGTVPSGSGPYTCVTFQGQTGWVQAGWFGMDACYGNQGNSSGPLSCTNNGFSVP